MKPAREAIASIVNDALKRTLAKGGFASEPYGFRRRRGDTIDLVRVRIDDVYGPTGRFYLRVGSYHPRIRKLLSQPVLELPTDDECTVRKRFGPDAGGVSMGVWIVGDAKQSSLIKSELADLWRAAIEPWLALAGDLRALHGAIDDGTVDVPERLVPIAVALSVDDKVGAQRRLDEALRQIRTEVDADGEPTMGVTTRVLVDIARLAAVHGLVDAGA